MFENLQNLPIAPFLTKICETLKNSPSRFLVLTAETAAGKSTAVPVALLKNFAGKILMLEPRRLAAVALADRISDLLCEQTGKTVGYTLSLESRTSADTRLEVITEAILTRRLQNDPLLEDVNVIILDEFHERSVHCDLALAFLKETMALRDDLFVIVMSATMDSKKTAGYLSTPAAPVLTIPGRQFPVKIVYKDKISVKNAVLEEFNDTGNTIKQNERSLVQTNSNTAYRTDSILVFLPGIYEITKVRTELENTLSPQEAEICVLHSSVSLNEQKKNLSPVLKSSPRRIILSSAIAETSLTVPGVTTVIDSGLVRVNKMNVALGMETLTTEKINQFSADQRAGRAGRLMSGKCIRLWNQFEPLKKELSPEILRCNLANLVLECAQWGSIKLNSFDWLDAPPLSAWNSNIKLLTDSGFLKDQKITQSGKYALSLGLDVRLGCALLYSKQSEHIQQGIDFVLKSGQYKNFSEQQKKLLSQNLIKRLEKCSFTQKIQYSNAGLLLAGFPDRLAKKIPQNEQNEVSVNRTIYQFPSGHKAFIESGFQSGPEWIVATEVNAGTSLAKIYTYEKVESNEIESWLKTHSTVTELVEFEENSTRLNKFKITKFGEIILKSIKLPSTQKDFGLALCNEIKHNGLKKIPANQKIMNFLCRAQFYAKHADDGLFEKLENLKFTPEEWLLPFITSDKIDEEIVFNALYYFLEGSKIDAEVPAILVLENGKKAKISYENRLNSTYITLDDFITNVRSLNIEPVLEIIIQQIFGCFSTPKILGVPILLKLLSPARRPLQITDNLSTFWSGAWIEICKEMKGRYPKHNWDYKLTSDS